MPAFVKTPAQEKVWARAKAIVAEQRAKAEKSFTDKDWGLVNHIYQNMVDAGIKRVSARADDVGVLLANVEYMLARRRRKVKADKNEDLDDGAKAVVEALSAVMAVGGQTIAAVRKAKSLGRASKEGASVARELHSLADRLTKLLSSLKDA